MAHPQSVYRHLTRHCLAMDFALDECLSLCFVRFATDFYKGHESLVETILRPINEHVAAQDSQLSPNRQCAH